VIHLAALPSVPRSIQDPLTTNAVNVAATGSVVLAARDAGTQRVVFASSSSAYGRARELPKTESLVPRPISRYGVSKLAAEQYCMGLNIVYSIEVAALLQRPRPPAGSKHAVQRRYPRFAPVECLPSSGSMEGAPMARRMFAVVDVMALLRHWQAGDNVSQMARAEAAGTAWITPPGARPSRRLCCLRVTMPPER